jgi:hypothetical protein
MYMETSKITVESVIFALISTSIISGGSGVTIASRMKRTPTGTASSAFINWRQSAPPPAGWPAALAPPAPPSDGFLPVAGAAKALAGVDAMGAVMLYAKFSASASREP